jgi:hypothetical protein
LFVLINLPNPSFEKEGLGRITAPALSQHSAGLERRSRSGDSFENQIYFIPATRYINSAYRSVVKREKPNGYFYSFFEGKFIYNSKNL